MIIANGYIQFRTSAAGVMGADGYPAPAAEKWSEPIACQFSSNEDMLARSRNEAYTQRSYTLLIDRMEPMSEVVKLFNERGEVGQFSMRSYEHLDAVCQTRIYL